MTSLLWPGEHRAGELLSDRAVLTAMFNIENAWLAELIDADISPQEARCDLTEVVGDEDLEVVAEAAEGGANPVIGLVHLLRERTKTTNPAASRWLHRGLTSQDVLDTALVLALHEALARIERELRNQVVTLVGLVNEHRRTIMAGRTLTQHAVPTTFGRKAAGWLGGLVAAARDVRAVAGSLPAQFGGASGTMAALTELARIRGQQDAAGTAWKLATAAAHRLGLDFALPWHTTRVPLTRAADVLVRACDAWGHIAGDVLTLSRPEFGELREPIGAGRGGSSAMPHKANPVLAVLLRRTALAAPALGAQLHLAAAEQCDERAAGPWHLEWPALQGLGRGAAAAASQATELLAGLQVNAEAMEHRAVAATEDLLAEQQSIVELCARDKPGLSGADTVATPTEPADYLGATEIIITVALDDAEAYLQERL